MPDIEHGNMVDITELATAAQEAAYTVTHPENYDEDEIAEAKEFLVTLANFCGEFSQACDVDEPDTIVDALNHISRNEEYLIAEDYFTAYSKQLCEDLGDLPSDLPWYISNHIDWDGVAESLKVDYSTVTLDGETYLHRDS